LERYVEKASYVAVFIAMTLGMLGAVGTDKDFANWGELTKGLAQIKVTVALGYAALIAAVGSMLKHGGQFAKHKKTLYNMIKAFGFAIFMDMLLYVWSFEEHLRVANIALFLLGNYAFLYVSINFFRVIREMINLEEE
jgi:hypothetical protein